MQKVKRIISMLLVLLITLSCAGCNSNKGLDSKPVITVTIFPLYDFVRAVAGDTVNIHLLIKPGTEVHSFDPAPSDIVTVNKSDLLIKIGGESEEWLKKIENSFDKKVKTVAMMNYVTLLNEDGEDEYDEHIWTSPENAVKMIKKTADELIAVYPDNKKLYTENRDIYIEKIRGVQDEIKSVVDKSNKKFIIVADRFPFKYLTTEYGVSYEAAFGGCASSSDISLKAMKRIIDTVEKNNCTGVFYTEMSSKIIANAVHDETGVAAYELHSAHNVTLDDFNKGITYLDILKANSEAIRKGIM